MHRYDARTEEIAQLCFDYAIDRLRLFPVPLDGPLPAPELERLAGQTITRAGRSPEEVMALFADVLAPACVSNDSPKFLAFIPGAPTKASQLFDVVVSASSIYGGSWMEGSGAVYAENQALRWVADLAGLPDGAGGCFVSGGSAANLSALVAARESAARRRGDRPARWRVAVGDQAHSSLDSTIRIMDALPLIVPTGDDDRLHGSDLRAALD
ncbi:MAG: pyridoxal-dependent decarboxylase, partial [Acidimicrobiia bacterium]